MQIKPHTRKGEQSREHIFQCALALFQAKGYAATTMRDIATAAGTSLGLTYRYFDSKEALVLALYRRLAQALEAQVQTFAPGSLADRFKQAMQAKLALVTPYRDILGALFGAAMDPRSTIAVLGDTTADVRQQVSKVFVTVVTQAKDAPKEPQASQLALMLYGAHLALLLFWLNDRTPQAQATHELLTLMRDTLALLRPGLGLPPVAKLLTRLTAIVGPTINVNPDQWKATHGKASAF